MPYRVAIAVVALVCTTTGALALSDLDRFQLAQALGAVLGSESVCALSYNPAAIEAFIEERVPADDMQFPSILATMTQGAGYDLEEMSDSAKTAHCAQIRRIAKSYGFVE